MIEIQDWSKAWALLEARERRNAWIVLSIVILAAISSGVMVGSVVPFLMVLADPERIENVSALTWAYEAGNFESDYSFLIALGAASLAIIVIGNVLQIIRSWAVTRFSLMRVHSLSHRLLAAYLRQPYEYFLNHHTGDMSAQILAESREAVNLFFRPAGDMLASIFTAVAIVAVMLWLDPVVAVAAFGILGTIYAGTFLLSRRLITRMGRVRADAASARFRLANEALSGFKEIKLIGQESAYVDRYRTPSEQMARAAVKVQVLGEIPVYVIQTVAYGGIIALCLIMLDPGNRSSGAALGDILPLLGAFAFAGQRLLPELQRIYRSMTDLKYGAAAIDAVHRDLVSKDETPELPRTLPEPLGLKTELMLENVTYRYPQADHSGLRDVSLCIRAGEKIGIVGSTGAGKTTLADLILGLLRPVAGRLIVDGTEITDRNLRAWQQTIGYVPQDIFLTDASVAENIALGLTFDQIDMNRLRRAARVAQIENFVQQELPEGYNTIVGEKGVRLSGGQRQRIGIARALYHNADLVVFDEATSALDNLTERDVMSAVEALQGDKTVLMIAHRLSTIQLCDRILVMDSGRVSDFATWEELAANNTRFRALSAATQP